MMMSAPARRTTVKGLHHRAGFVDPAVSRRRRRASRIATDGYAAVGMPNSPLTRADVPSRYVIAGFTITISAPPRCRALLPAALRARGRDHLMRSAIAERRRGAGCLAKGVIKRRAVFRGVGHDPDVTAAALVESRPLSGRPVRPSRRRGRCAREGGEREQWARAVRRSCRS